MSTQTESGFRPDIEGLRALAVTGVVAFHFGITGLSGGFVGVDVFFVISGYLITRHLQQEIASRGTVNLWQFYARRARRLLPASLFVILATLLAGYFILSPTEQHLYSKGALFASAYAINLWLIRWSFDYFATDVANNPFLHFWSLSVEEQFYLFWPAVLIFFAWLRPGKHGVFLLMALAGAVSFALCWWFTTVSQPWAFYFSPLRAWEFAFGGLASMAISENWAKRSRYSPALGWLGVALIVATYLTISEEDPFPGLIALAPVAGTAMVLLSGAHQGLKGPKVVLALEPFQWIGKLSYSLYLWHWPVIVYALILKPDLTAADRLLCLALTVVLSMFSYHFIENPVRRNSWLMASSGRSLGFAALLTAMGVTLAYGSANLATRNVDPRQRLILESAEQKTAAREVDPECVARLETVEPNACELGVAGSDRTIVLFGDSHADHWSTPLAKIARDRGWRLVTFLKGACPVAKVPVWSWALKRKFEECESWRNNAIAEIASLKPDLVVISQFSQHYVRNRVEDDYYRPVDVETWVEGVRYSVEALSGSGTQVALLHDTPLHKAYLDKCVARALWQGRDSSVCDTPRIDAIDDSVHEAEMKIVSGIKNARYVDITGMLCNDTVCPAMIDGRLAFRDRQHLATPFAETLAAPLERAIFQETVMGAVKN